MVLLKRWEPLAELRRMDADMNRVWRHGFRPLYLRPRLDLGDGRVTIDAYWGDNNLVVRATLPGVKAEDVDVTITGDTLTIKGESKSEAKEVKERNYLYRERSTGSFQRAVALPDGLDRGKGDASYDNGILTVTIPRSEESKPKALKISVKPLEDKNS